VVVWEKLTTYLSHLQKQNNISVRAMWDYQTVLSPFLRVFFAQMSPSFRVRFVRGHVAAYVSSERHIGAVAEVTLILTWAVSSDPVAVLQEVVPRVLHLVWKKGKFFDAGVSVLTWALELLAGCAKRAGEALIPYVEQMATVGLACVNYAHSTLDSQEVKKRGAALLGTVLLGLLSHRVQDNLYDPSRKNHFLHWGETELVSALGQTHWSGPSDAAVASAARLMKQMLGEAEQALESELLDQDVQKIHLLLHAVLSAEYALPFCSDEEDLNERAVAKDNARGLPPYILMRRQLGSELPSLEFVRRAVRDMIFCLHDKLLRKVAYCCFHVVFCF
jgi:hypothetical protein